ncbi:MAG: terpene cyclase/mutase family protein [Thermoplasmata archaeon]|nr:terpene cyclase/mutase family protein [Thermoplasmata archaeon]
MSKKNYKIYQSSIQKGLAALFVTLKQYLEKQIELERIIKVSLLLIKSGVNQNNSIFQEIVRRCLTQQKEDGGWIGVEDSLWCVAFLKEFEEYSQEYRRGLEWLKKQKLKNGSWGKTDRDIGRIPLTGILLYLLPELSNKESLKWLESEWKKEFSINPKLTYKSAFTLMTLKSNNYHFADSNFFDDTLDWLESQQNEDYGWGPCKGQPIGSTPFYTGVAIIGLLQYPDRINRNVIANGLKWIEKKQLEDGLWPDHYIEEGSIWSLFALTEGYKLLKGL